MNKAQIRTLAGLDFVRRAENVLLIGDTGTGKTGLGIGLLREACLNGYNARFYNPTLGVFTQPGFVTVIFVLFLLAVFDTVGTLVGVSERAGFMKNGKLPRAQQALFSDRIRSPCL